MKRKKITKQEAAWWIYLLLIVAMALYGFHDSAAAESLIRALRGAFDLLIGN